VGIFQAEIEILTAHGGAGRREIVLVDTGASYLALPRSVLTTLGYWPFDSQRVLFATGDVALWDVTEVKIRLQGRERTVLAFLTPDEAPKLLGAQTLETFGLGVDPLAKRLVPVDAYLVLGKVSNSWWARLPVSAAID
jgi:clan AA aspartic protease